MIIPYRDAKLSRYEMRSFATPVHFLSSAKIRGDILQLDNHIMTKRIVLKTCVDKEYILAFFDSEIVERAKRSGNHPYFVNTRSIRDVLKYASRYDQSLLVMDTVPEIWHKVDPCSPIVDVFSIDFAKPKLIGGIETPRDI